VQRYILGRIIQAIVLVFLISVVVFVMARLSGDPIEILMPPEATQADIEWVRKDLGLDRPWPEQYWRFIRGAVQGDFGRSIRYRRPAINLVMERFPATLELGGLAILISILIAIPIGVYSAVFRGSRMDAFGRAFAAFGQAVPPFWLGLVLVLIFSIFLRWLPTSGRGTFSHVILPAITLGWFAAAGNTRLTRSAMLDVLGAEYVKLARMKGVPERWVIWKHAFRNAALPVLTYAALQLVTLLTGSIIVETVFAWPGVGRLVVEAVESRDYPIVQTVVMILGTMYLFVNLIIDVLYGYINPKIRYQS
jgi:peptide/nickel transport system permease protein